MVRWWQNRGSQDPVSPTSSRRHFLRLGAIGAASTAGLIAASDSSARAQATGLSFYPVVHRVYDSRIHDGPLLAGENRSFRFDQTLVPGSAAAVLINLTITNTNGRGFLAVGPGLISSPPDGSYSNINWWDSNLTLANMVTSTLGFEPLVGTSDTDTGIVIHCGGPGSTDYLIDVQGYYT